MLSAEISSPYSEIIQDVLHNRPSGMEELNRIFGAGARLLLSRRLPSAIAEDRLQRVFGQVERAILAGELCDPDQLTSFIRCAIKEQTASVACMARGARTVAGFLEDLPRREREAVSRYYLGEQSEQHICAEMRIPESQFRALRLRLRQDFERQNGRPDPRS